MLEKMQADDDDERSMQLSVMQVYFDLQMVHIVDDIAKI